MTVAVKSMRMFEKLCGGFRFPKELENQFYVIKSYEVGRPPAFDQHFINFLKPDIISYLIETTMKVISIHYNSRKGFMFFFFPFYPLVMSKCSFLKMRLNFSSLEYGILSVTKK